MKKILLLFTLALSLFSCENKWPINGYLDGQWQLMTIDHNGNQTNKKGEKIYWNFQLHMLMLNVSNTNYFAHFEHSNDSIRLCDISFSSANEKKEDDNIRMSGEEIKDILSPYGIDVVDESYKVESLSDETMILSNNGKVLTFRKF